MSTDICCIFVRPLYTLKVVFKQPLKDILMKHLFVSDMDGTLLGSDSRVSPVSADIISRLSRSGVPITVATARTPASVEVLLADTLISVPAIVMTGAALWDCASGRYLRPVLLPPDALVSALGLFARHGINPFVYSLDGDSMLTVTHVPEMNRWETAFYQERRMLKRKRFVFGYDDGASSGESAILVFGMDEAFKIETLADELRRDARLSVSCYRDIFNPAVANIEVFAAGVSKAAAIRSLASEIGADRITVYGDNLNDLPMFGIADDAVAVANAVPEVLASARRIIGPNTADSVALDILRVSQYD